MVLGGGVSRIVGMTRPKLHQALFQMTAANGTEFSLAILEDERCAILRDGDIAEIHESDEQSLERAISKYFKMLDESGGARHPYQVEEPTNGGPRHTLRSS